LPSLRQHVPGRKLAQTHGPGEAVGGERTVITGLPRSVKAWHNTGGRPRCETGRKPIPFSSQRQFRKPSIPASRVSLSAQPIGRPAGSRGVFGGFCRPFETAGRTGYDENLASRPSPLPRR
jgi:hypothetical protein